MKTSSKPNLPLHYAVAEEDHAALRSWVSAGFELETRDEHGATALNKAAMYPDFTCFELLLNAGAAIDTQDDRGSTPLHRAAFCGNDAMVDLLLKSGAKQNIQDENGMTALHVAITSGSQAMVQQMLNSGANLTIKDKLGRLPQELSVARRPQVLHPALKEVVNDASKGFNESWKQFTKRTGQPKLGWLIHECRAKHIRIEIQGESRDAEITYVHPDDEDAAWAILAPIDDVPDDDPMFGECEHKRVS